MRRMAVSWVALALPVLVSADIYMHNPRGSNNRLNENTRERKNGNRLFDSQNNNRGGYNVGSTYIAGSEITNTGSMYYFGTSLLQVEWTNQHSCGDVNANCELVMQYYCDEHIRDGTSTSTPPERGNEDNPRFGMHEDQEYYKNCRARSRNTGIFEADQDLDGNRAKYTRQNPKGTRRGLECPEERDYYPYWGPTPWVDVAILTNDKSRCDLYQKESQNVKSKFHCVPPANFVNRNNPEQGRPIPIDQTGCTGIGGQWTEVPAHGVPAPECLENEYSRDNHLGNGIGGRPNMYNWTLPNIDANNCVFRLRYNISTNDYDSWKTDASSNPSDEEMDLSAKYGLGNQNNAEQRGYIFENNPEVEIFGDAPDNKLKLRLAINTAQFGRTFQDRSHVFAIRKRPTDATGTIHNLNVRGKRGNIVQTYPAVEYDFVPFDLEVVQGDTVHVQWTGSNTNPKNNDGEGKAGTDRNNLVLLAAQQYPEGTGAGTFSHGAKFGHLGVNFPMQLSNVSFMDIGSMDMELLAVLNPGLIRGQTVGSTSRHNRNDDDNELNKAAAYFDLGPRTITSAATPGIYHYMCTRNNNFSNRDQKGRVSVFTQAQAKALGKAKRSLEEITVVDKREMSERPLPKMRGPKMGLAAIGKALDQLDAAEGAGQMGKMGKMAEPEVAAADVDPDFVPYEVDNGPGGLSTESEQIAEAEREKEEAAESELEAAIDNMAGEEEQEQQEESVEQEEAEQEQEEAEQEQEEAEPVEDSAEGDSAENGMTADDVTADDETVDDDVNDDVEEPTSERERRVLCRLGRMLGVQEAQDSGLC